MVAWEVVLIEASFGIFLASLASALVYSFYDDEAIGQYGWRLAFAGAILFGIVSFKMRQNLSETIVFKRLRTNIPYVPIFAAIQTSWKEILEAAGIICLHATSFYMLFMFLPTYLNKYLNLPMSTSYINNSIILLVRICLIPVIGSIADKIGGKRILLYSSLFFMFMSYPLFKIIITDIYTLRSFAIIILSLMTALNAATVPGLLMKSLPLKTRYISFSLVMNICFVIFGGLVPTLVLLMVDYFKLLIAPSFYLIFCSLITTLMLLKNWRRIDE